MRLRYFILLSLLVVALAFIPYSDILKPLEFDFDISVSPSPSSIDGYRQPTFGELECAVTVALTEGFAQPVSLTLSGFPNDTLASYSYEFSPASGVPPFSSTLKITVRNFSSGMLKLTVVGTGGGKTNSTIMFVVMHIDDDVR